MYQNCGEFPHRRRLGKTTAMACSPPTVEERGLSTVDDMLRTRSPGKFLFTVQKPRLQYDVFIKVILV